jgi:hypothetical protein
MKNFLGYMEVERFINNRNGCKSDENSFCSKKDLIRAQGGKVFLEHFDS